MTRYGATPAEWAHFDLVLGLTADLLPVVSNPKAVIARRSTLKSLGKVPSTYNNSRQVMGVWKWTSRITTPSEISRWVRQSDYGICVQTRSVRAIDVDVADARLAGEIVEHFTSRFGPGVALRGREGSSRVLLALVVPGPLDKRVIRLADGCGIIELLADGQQFVACGEHPSGARYAWHLADGTPGLPDSLAAVTRDALDAAWGDAAERWHAGPAPVERTSSAGGGAAPRQGHDDPVIDWLDARGWLAEARPGAKGQLFVHCPWKEDHTGDSGPTETAYYPAGTGGYEMGHFHCLHAHCGERTDAEFLDAVGYHQSLLEMFEDLDAPGATQPPVVVAPLPAVRSPPTAGERALLRGRLPSVETWFSTEPGKGLKRSKKGFLATIDNVTRALDTEGWGWRLGFDAFKDEILRSTWVGGAVGGAANGHARLADLDWQAFTDADYVGLRVEFERAGFEPVGRDLVRDAVHVVAAGRCFDSALAWIDGLPAWDGRPRAAAFLERYCAGSPGRQDGRTPARRAYQEAVGRYLWSALAGRVLSPGVQADMALILVGEQGVGKTRLLQAMVPEPTLAVTIDLAARDADLARRMRGRLLFEIAELRGLHTKELNAIKDFVSQSTDTWTPKYKEFATSYPRRGIMVGTTNEDSMLADETGNRRWLPVRVGTIDLAAVRRDRDQLWAEGAVMFLEGGVAWEEAMRLATGEHAEYMMEDSWQPSIERWLESPRRAGDGEADGFADLSSPASPTPTPPAGGAPLPATGLGGQVGGGFEGGGALWGAGDFTTRDVLVLALGLDERTCGRAQEMRVSRVLAMLGFERTFLKDRTRRTYRVWCPKTQSNAF